MPVRHYLWSWTKRISKSRARGIVFCRWIQGGRWCRATMSSAKWPWSLMTRRMTSKHGKTVSAPLANSPSLHHSISMPRSLKCEAQRWFNGGWKKFCVWGGFEAILRGSWRLCTPSLIQGPWTQGCNAS